MNWDKNYLDYNEEWGFVANFDEFHDVSEAVANAYKKDLRNYTYEYGPNAKIMSEVIDKVKEGCDTFVSENKTLDIDSLEPYLHKEFALAMITVKSVTDYTEYILIMGVVRRYTLSMKQAIISWYLTHEDEDIIGVYYPNAYVDRHVRIVEEGTEDEATV